MSSGTQQNQERKSALEMLNAEKQSKKEEEKVERTDYQCFVIPKLEKFNAYSFYDNVIKFQKNGLTCVFPAKALKNSLTHKGDFSFTHPNINYRPDREMYNALLNAGLKSQAIFAQNSYASNNTMFGLYKRFTAQIIPEGTNYKPPSHVDVYSRFFFNSSKLVQGPLNEEAECFKNLTSKSCAGLPFAFQHKDNVAPKVEDEMEIAIDYFDPKSKPVRMKVLAHAMHYAKMFYQWCRVENRNDFFAQMKKFIDAHPEFNTFLLKRKSELQQREDYNNKVRPYGVQPLAMRLFGKWAMHPIIEALVPFYENHRSCSAYGFSAFYGGGRKIIKWLKAHVADFVDMKQSGNSQRYHFAGISFGDDQLWVIYDSVTELLHIEGPDVSAMDMNTSRGRIVDLMKIIDGVVNTKHYANAIYFNLIISFQRYVHIGGPYIIYMINSLMSGVVGTTFINIHSSAQIQTIAQDVCAKYTGDVDGLYTAITTEVTERLGYTFKPRTEKNSQVLKFSDLDEKGITVPFLSFEVKIINGEPVCVPADYDKFGGTFCVPCSHTPTTYSMERVLGAFLSGACFDEKLNTFCRNMYAVKRLANNKEKMIRAESSVDPDAINEITKWMESKTRRNLLKQGSLPSDACMLDMMVLDHDDFYAKWDNLSDLVEEAKTVVPTTMYREFDLSAFIQEPTTTSSKDEVDAENNNNNNSANTNNNSKVEEQDASSAFTLLNKLSVTLPTPKPDIVNVEYDDMPKLDIEQAKIIPNSPITGGNTLVVDTKQAFASVMDDKNVKDFIAKFRLATLNNMKQAKDLATKSSKPDNKKQKSGHVEDIPEDKNKQILDKLNTKQLNDLLSFGITRDQLAKLMELNDFDYGKVKGKLKNAQIVQQNKKIAKLNPSAKTVISHNITKNNPPVSKSSASHGNSNVNDDKSIANKKKKWLAKMELVWAERNQRKNEAQKAEITGKDKRNKSVHIDEVEDDYEDYESDDTVEQKGASTDEEDLGDPDAEDLYMLATKGKYATQQ